MSAWGKKVKKPTYWDFMIHQSIGATIALHIMQ